MTDKMIGIVGGVGSYAGIDLIKKIYDLTNAQTDQDHLPISMISIPRETPDRTKFILGETGLNPAIAIADIICRLADSGAEVIGIPCNTAHAKLIFDVIKDKIPSSCKLVNMVEEVGLYLNKNFPRIGSVGILATTGTIISNIYPEILEKYNLTVIQPSIEIQKQLVHRAIYDQQYGIKAFGNPVTQKAKNDLIKATLSLVKKGAEAIILACTEIPLAITEKKIENSFFVDATSILAAALIRESRKEQGN
jgi:aspartate racemase